MKNSTLPFLFCLMLFLFSCDYNDLIPEEEIEQIGQIDDSGDALAEGRCYRSYVRNGNFQRSVDFNDPGGRHATWIKEGYLLNSGVFMWQQAIGRGGSGGVMIETGAGPQNDLAITQKVVLDPAKFYRLSAWVKTVDVVGGMGANVCLYNTWTSSGTFTGTNDWQQISIEFTTPPSGEVTIACRLGFWAGVSSGKAYFDDVLIEEVPKFVLSTAHIRLVIDPEDASAVSKNTIKVWLANLERAYEKYRELMGGYPYNGGVITIQSVEKYPGGWAVAGNPILWYKPYIRTELQDIQATGTWSFGIMHELAHDFVLDNSNKNWIWNEEMFANFRMYYAVQKLNIPILQGKLYVGAGIKNYYKEDAQQSYSKGIAQGIPVGHDGLMYTLIRIKNQIGWKPFIDTFKDLNASSYNPSSNEERFNLFLDKLSSYSGTDVRQTYLPGELSTIGQLLR